MYFLRAESRTLLPLRRGIHPNAETLESFFLCRHLSIFEIIKNHCKMNATSAVNTINTTDAINTTKRKTED